ncbi:MAG: hypothetical protein ABI910_12000 [Gemmatimonadota bacterium]
MTDAPVSAETREEVTTFATTPRPRSLLYGLVGVIVVESVAVHALLYPRHPVLSLLFLVSNVATVWYLVRELATSVPVIVTRDALDVRSGRSIRLRIPVASVTSVRQPEWRDLPAAGSKGYLKIAGSDDPNVLLVLDPPAVAVLPFGMRRSVSTLGLHLTAPAGFVAAIETRVGAPPVHADIHR